MCLVGFYEFTGIHSREFTFAESILRVRPRCLLGDLDGGIGPVVRVLRLGRLTVVVIGFADVAEPAVGVVAGESGGGMGRRGCAGVVGW